MSDLQQILIISIVFSPIIILGILWMSLELLISVKKCIIELKEIKEKGI